MGLGKSQALPQEEETEPPQERNKNNIPPIVCNHLIVLISPAFTTTDPAQMQQEHPGIHMKTEVENPPRSRFLAHV